MDSNYNVSNTKQPFVICVSQARVFDVEHVLTHTVLEMESIGKIFDCVLGVGESLRWRRKVGINMNALKKYASEEIFGDMATLVFLATGFF